MPATPPAPQAFFKEYLPHISVDCVVFGFDAKGLKVLLLKMKHLDEWALPGGFVRWEEPVESAATRVLRERTGLEQVFLQQFRVFSEPQRSKENKWSSENEALQGWLNQRFITIGFYALVPFEKVAPQPDAISEACTWWNLSEVGQLLLDHNAILHSALEALRLQMRYQPIGYNLLPEKFTMPELQKLYETVLGRRLDRRNFQRRMMDFGLLEKLPERKTGVAHKAPYFYRFNKAQYEKALEEGLAGEW
jgi:ADP-ribose pyrophosphatase YjhB (NUDIX family)